MKKHIAQFIKFLQDKEGKPAPLRLKLLDPQTWGKPTREELNVKGDLDLSKTSIKELPQGLKVGGELDLRSCISLEKLPQDLKVGRHLWLNDCTSLKTLPQGLEVEWSLWLNYCTSLEKLPQDLKVGNDLILEGCASLEKLPQGLKVAWSLHLSGCTSLKELPQGLKVYKNLFVRNTPIAEKYSKEEIEKMIEDGGGYVNGIIFI